MCCCVGFVVVVWLLWLLLCVGVGGPDWHPRNKGERDRAAARTRAVGDDADDALAVARRADDAGDVRAVAGDVLVPLREGWGVMRL